MIKPIDYQGHELLLLEHKNGDEFPWFIAIIYNSRINSRLRVRMVLNKEGYVFDTEISYSTIESYIAEGTLVRVIG